MECESLHTRIEDRSGREARTAIRRTIADRWHIPVSAHMKENENANPIGWNARTAPGPNANPASVCLTPSSAACASPPEWQTARGRNIKTPPATMMPRQPSVQMAARNPPEPV